MNAKLMSETIKGLSLIFAYIMIEPLVKEIQDTFGSSFIYHPIAVWLTLFSLVYVNTDSVYASVTVIIVYELIKMLWTFISPSPPHVSKLRKLIHRVQNEQELSNDDIVFINDITPKNVVFTRK